jgi:hypothetical protein
MRRTPDHHQVRTKETTMMSKSNLLGGAFLLASLLGLSAARAEGAAPARADGPKVGAQAKSKSAGRAAGRTTGKRATPAPSSGKAQEPAATPASVVPSPAPSAEKMQELHKHPVARSGRGHL